MIDLKNKSYYPLLEEIGEYVANHVFMQFCTEIKEKYGCMENIEFSSCSMEPGWNIKFKKSGKSLCTLYPREAYFTVMVVIGRKEKEAVEAMLSVCTPELCNIYNNTKEANGQKWLMIDLEDDGNLYQDIFRLIEIRSNKKV